MDVLDTLQISASGLTAERTRMQTISENLANARTTRTQAGGPYQRKVPVFESQAIRPFADELDSASQVVVTAIQSDGRPAVRQFDPSHPDADAQGYVSLPDINVLQEMVDLMNASRSYEANASALETTRDMALRALEIGR
jgi:flagellar basal-body rod protein FlgC